MHTWFPQRLKVAAFGPLLLAGMMRGHYDEAHAILRYFSRTFRIEAGA